MDTHECLSYAFSSPFTSFTFFFRSFSSTLTVKLNVKVMKQHINGTITVINYN